MKPTLLHQNKRILVRLNLILISLSLIITIDTPPDCNAQIVSHELRRLAVATNQFGIDALKALDRIEPPDKVLVFCPVCLSSSLMMIMMGSSKYQVVSSMRHALYVWSMKPHEINKGFQDIFDHIGVNQQQQAMKTSETRLHNAIEKSQFGARHQAVGLNYQPIKSTTRHTQNEILETAASSYERNLSLPKLMKVREYLSKRTMKEDSGAWWKAFERKTEIDQEQSSNKTLLIKNPSHSTNFNHNQKDEIKSHKRDSSGGDLSQMSATSNIYLQRGLAMNYNYNLLLRQYYRTFIHPVDFVKNGEETRQHINSLVATNTEGKIKDLVKKGTFEKIKTPKIMIITTFHFRGTLDIQMKANDMKKNKTRSTREMRRSAKNLDQLDKNETWSSKKLFIETEETLLKHAIFPDLDSTVIEIPFNNRLVSLVIVMPNHLNSTELVLTKLSAQVLSDMINSLKVKKLSIETPVIKFDRGPVNVDGIVKELGLDSAFMGNKPFSSETGLNKWMRPSDIVHETSIDIGTINPNWSQTEDRLKVGAHDDQISMHNVQERGKNTKSSNHIKLDKPFFYFVFDSINGLVLTMGRIRQ